MLNAIAVATKDFNEIFSGRNGTKKSWDESVLNQIFVLHPGHNSDKSDQISVEVSGRDIRFSSCDVNGSLLNFSSVGEKILLAPKNFVITLTFNKPIFAAGAKIGVSGSPSDDKRPFEATINANNGQLVQKFTADGNKFPASTNNIDQPPALFLGAISKTEAATLEVIKFSVQSTLDPSAPGFVNFAIGSLFFMQNSIR